MRYLDLTKPEDIEPTYTRAQWVAGIVASVALVGVLAGTALSLISAL
jgi:hypothetical protein